MDLIDILSPGESVIFYIPVPNSDISGSDRCLEPVFTITKCFFSGFPVGNICNGPQISGDIFIPIIQCNGTAGEPGNFPLWSNKPVFGVKPAAFFCRLRPFPKNSFTIFRIQRLCPSLTECLTHRHPGEARPSAIHK